MKIRKTSIQILQLMFTGLYRTISRPWAQASTAGPAATLSTKKNFGEASEMFWELLEKYESQALVPELKNLAKAIEEVDYPKIKTSVHKIKGGSSYMGAGQITQKAAEIHNYIDFNVDFVVSPYIFYKREIELINIYPQLIDSVIKYKRHADLIMYKYKRVNNKTKTSMTVRKYEEDIPLAPDYVIIQVAELQYQCVQKQSTQQKTIKRLQSLKNNIGFSGSNSVYKSEIEQSDGGGASPQINRLQNSSTILGGQDFRTDKIIETPSKSTTEKKNYQKQKPQQPKYQGAIEKMKLRINSQTDKNSDQKLESVVETKTNEKVEQSCCDKQCIIF